MLNNYSIEKKHYKIGDFEGPLDLLLFLIKKNEVNIYDIPISYITEQYLEYLEYLPRIDLENLTEFYLLASTLLYIKSRMLLPVELYLNDEIEDPRSDLVDQLIDYQKYKKLGEIMALKEKETEWTMYRKKNQLKLPFDNDEIWEQINVWDLLKHFSSIISSLSAEKIYDFYEEVTINEKIILIHEYLEKHEDFVFTMLIKDVKSMIDIVCAFLAILEMVKTKYIIIFQNKLFGDIRIRKNKGQNGNEY